jgi:hypothetical protein
MQTSRKARLTFGTSSASQYELLGEAAAYMRRANIPSDTVERFQGDSMANPPSIQRFYADDYKEAPPWFKQRFLNTLNLFVFPTYNALNKNLTIGENINQGYTTISLTGSVTATDNTASFLNPIEGNPTGVDVVNVQIVGTPTQEYPTAAVQVFWSFDGSSIQIGAVTGLANSVNYELTLRVE